MPIEWTRRTIIQLLENPPAEAAFIQRSGTSYSLWCFPPKLFDDSQLVLVCFPTVRGLSNASFSETLSALLKATGLGIQSLSNVPNWIFATVWLNFVLQSQERNAYRDALSMWPEARPRSGYPLFALSGISKLIEQGTGQQEIEDAVNDFESVFPKFTGIFPFFLLQTCCQRLVYRVSTALWVRAVGIIRHASVNKEWLKASCQMDYISKSPFEKELNRRAVTEPEPPSLDLLLWFGELLDRAILRGDVPEDGYANAARDYVSGLITERTPLLSESDK